MYTTLPLEFLRANSLPPLKVRAPPALFCYGIFTPLWPRWMGLGLDT